MSTSRPPSPEPLQFRRIVALVVVALASLLAVAPAWAGDTSTTLPNGAELTGEVTAPVGGDTFLVPTGSSGVDVPLTGTASVGQGQPDVTWIYVVDVSGSTEFACDAARTILDCEKEAVTNLNALVVGSGSAVEVGVAIFGQGSQTADMQPAAGDQPLVAPDSADVGVVVDSIGIGVVGQYDTRTVGTDGTDFTAGLQAAASLASSATGGTVNVVYLSDGVSNEGGGGFAAALAAVTANADVHPFAVGSTADCAGGTDGTLAEMAAASGTTCAEVEDPADLPEVVSDLVATRLLEVTVTVDGTPVAATVDPTPPRPGPVTVDWSATGADLAPGTHEVCVTVVGEGPVGATPPAVEQVTHCEAFSVFGFDLTPADAVNELGVDDTHAVTATVAGPAGELAGWPVDVVVADGPNAGDSGTCVPADCTTDADGQVTFTYTVPVEPESLGTDTIAGTVQVDDDAATVEVTKTWQDTTPPSADCPAGPNPGGRIPAAPGKGGQGQNQDGFYALDASDDVWPDDALEVFVRDTGSGTTWGPFAVGDTMKYTEANGASPRQSAGPGRVDHRLRGTGDAEVFAVDGSGNVSAAVDCLVPNPPM